MENDSVAKVKPESVLADLIDLITIAHHNTVKTLEAFNALLRAANDLDVRFEERYASTWLRGNRSQQFVD